MQDLHCYSEKFREKTATTHVGRPGFRPPDLLVRSPNLSLGWPTMRLAQKYVHRVVTSPQGSLTRNKQVHGSNHEEGWPPDLALGRPTWPPVARPGDKVGRPWLWAGRPTPISNPHLEVKFAHFIIFTYQILRLFYMKRW